MAVRSAAHVATAPSEAHVAAARSAARVAAPAALAPSVAAPMVVVTLADTEAHTEVDMVVVDNKSKNILGELKMLRGDVQI